MLVHAGFEERVAPARAESDRKRRAGAGRTVPMNIRTTPAIKAAMNALSRVDDISRTTLIERLVQAEIERRGVEVLPSDEHGEYDESECEPAVARQIATTVVPRRFVPDPRWVDGVKGTLTPASTPPPSAPAVSRDRRKERTVHVGIRTTPETKALVDRLKSESGTETATDVIEQALVALDARVRARELQASLRKRGALDCEGPPTDRQDLFTFRCSADLKDRIKRHVKKTGSSTAEFLERAIKEAMAHQTGRGKP